MSQKQHKVIGDSLGVCALSASHGGYSGVMRDQAAVFVLQRTNKQSSTDGDIIEYAYEYVWQTFIIQIQF